MKFVTTGLQVNTHRLTESSVWYDVTLSRWRAWPTPTCRCCPLARRARVTSLARWLRYSSWSIVHSYLLTRGVFVHSC